MSLRSRAERAAPTCVGETQFLVVACGRTYLAFPADIVHGIVEPAGAVGAESRSAPGVTCPMTDLAAQLGLACSTPSFETRIVLCAIRERRRALLVDRVAGLCDVETHRIRPLPPHFTGSERTWITGLFLFQESIALALNPDWLVGPEVTAPNQAAIVEQNPRMLAGTAESHDPGSDTIAEGVVPLVGASLESVEFEEATDAEDIPWAEL